MRPLIPEFGGAHWNERESEELKSRKRIYFLCEGQVTEFFYFKGLCKNSKNLGIKDTIKVDVFNKTGSTCGVTQPEKMYEEAKTYVEEMRSDESRGWEAQDRIIIVFDTDCFECQEDLNSFVGESNDTQIILGMSYPSFELFLFMHDDEKLENITSDAAKLTAIERNDKITDKDRACYHYFKEQFGFNPKKTGNETKLEEMACSVKNSFSTKHKVDNCMNGKTGCLHSNLPIILETELFQNA